VLCWYEWDFEAAERQLRKAVSLNPNDAEATWSFGSVLPTVGKLGEAITEMRRSVTLNPVFPRASRWLSRFLLYAGDYAEAIAQSQKALELDSEYWQSYHDAASATLALGDAEAALEWYRKGQSLDTAVRAYDALIVRALAVLNRREEAEEILSRLEEESRLHYVREEILAMGYAAMDNFDRAFACLDRAIQARSAGVIYLHLDPGYEPLRKDPRFDVLVKRIGLK
ncbi:MAG TPA: tetratricopeptide repeat protein, partial [Rhodothermia bacterium]|nr:tetratricopeptide repeat protein [Rhodothermia bacterium]